MKNQHQLINNIVGQMKGLDKMIKEKKGCFAVLAQMKAARSAIDSLSLKYLEEEFVDCLGSCKKGKKDEVCKKFFKELIKN
ncbi:MAG: metal-sensitive transcriptional regulator [Patescibacteria group bacterium]|nr:metal-sensitive transcriptional regulator [Patescibacteria group bacterium]